MPVNPLAEKLKLNLDYEQLTNCMRCGFCLPACPTFKETGVEAESPRGRIALMKAVTDGLMEPDKAFANQMNHCLGCRACEPVCPADVKYGHLLEQARDSIEDHTRHSWWIRLVRHLFFRKILPHQNRVKWIGLGLQLYEKTGLRKLVRKSGVFKRLPQHMSQMEAILPDSSYQGVVERLGATIPAKGAKIATVGLFRGCIMDVMFTDTNINTAKLLSEAGFEVIIPPGQNCCGALHAHSGEQQLAKELAKRNIEAFRETEVDYIVSNAGGCGAILVEYDHLLHGEPEWETQAGWFAARVRDVSDILAEKGNMGRLLERSEGESISGETSGTTAVAASTVITYQDSCHLRNVMRASSAPRQLLKGIDGVKFVELKESERCCGSAGIYNLTQPGMANQILDHKMEHVNHTGAHYLLTSNPGCLLQMKLGIERHKPAGDMKAVHIVDFLYEKLVKR
jgi:glycolate oxidase iron-sulfur subunit